MGWFEEQVRQRRRADRDAFEDAFIEMAGAVMGRRLTAALNNSLQAARDAVEEILKYYHAKPRDIPENVKNIADVLEYAMRPYGIMRRPVRLTPGWYRDAAGAMLGTRTDDGSPVALIPAPFSGYTFYDVAAGKRRRVSRGTASLIGEEAVVFYRPFPQRPMGTRDLLRFVWDGLSTADIALFLLSGLAVTAVGMAAPQMNAILFSDVTASGSTQVLLAALFFLFCTTAGGLLFRIVRALLLGRIQTKLGTAVDAAAMARLLSLPPGFFRNFGSGELANRLQTVSPLVVDLTNVVLSTGLAALFSLLYIPQAALYAPALALPALAVCMTSLGIALLSALIQTRVTREKMEAAAKESGMGYALITGIQKLRQTAAEQRAFARWGRLYAKEAALLYNPPLFLKINTALNRGIALAGALWMYAAAYRSGVGVADYYAFSTAYALVSGAFSALADTALTAAKIPPALDMIRPILEAEPEVAEEKLVIQKLSGGIELNNVTFRYNDSMPPVLNNLSLRIRANQYVAIVGTTGCGKSTLMRILLGFETPQKGAVYYDRKNISHIDLKSLRRKIGVVMQNGKLFTGDIFSNIAISAPELTMEQAWEAAEMAGMREDIEAMPMGMFTLVPEGGGGVSGGQRQRLMIARAIAPRPKILMFDEATSALDNVTQKRVSESLSKMKCTRIVIAHRLSTVKQCDRILVLDQGQIVEDGKYDKLIKKNGVFARLVARQILDESPIAGKYTVF